MKRIAYTSEIKKKRPKGGGSFKPFSVKTEFIRLPNLYDISELSALNHGHSLQSHASLHVNQNCNYFKRWQH